jgi:hypothetical protein
MPPPLSRFGDGAAAPRTSRPVGRLPAGGRKNSDRWTPDALVTSVLKFFVGFFGRMAPMVEPWQVLHVEQREFDRFMLTEFAPLDREFEQVSEGPQTYRADQR